ncbi:sterol carrier family protein [Streptomyces sp. ISL-11]|uniref:sterol carrier family protein n=1 Tax=Streptomyces sp. ISL-11 TaxID=2819174 RepID=UPI001BE90CAD|nr:sterol carrier family protein [Streptomyces sp. ISL-11]MBT2385401.1 hypothetical protein [Streptomyces sp. ISL-11]
MPPAPRRPRSRSYDPAKVRAALTGEMAVVRGLVSALCATPEAADLLARRPRAGAPTARELILRLAGDMEAAAGRLVADSAPAKADTGIHEYLAAGLPDDAPAEAPEIPEQPLHARVDDAAARLTAALDDPHSAAAVTTPAGTLTVTDFLLARLLTTVLHAEDLAAATGAPVPHGRQALATVTRLLADALAAKAPGGSVEVRIPPFAVVQCVAGPKHTRGTPPNVVETDPLTWLRLATGRTDWATAVDQAAVAASGERADLSAQLPLLI